MLFGIGIAVSTTINKNAYGAQLKVFQSEVPVLVEGVPKTGFQSKVQIVTKPQTQVLLRAVPKNRLISKKENLSKNRQNDIYQFEPGEPQKVVMDGIEFQAIKREHVDKETNKKTTLLSIFGTEGPYERLQKTAKKFVTSFGSNVTFNREECEYDHIGTARCLEAMSIPKKRAGVIVVLKPHNCPRTAGNDGLNYLCRPNHISYRVAIQDKLNPVEAFRPGIMNSFNRVVKKPTDILYSAENIELILKQVPLSINRFQNDVEEMFITSYEIPKGYAFMVMEASGSAIILEKEANRLLEQMRDNSKNFSPAYFLNPNIIKQVQTHLEFGKGVQECVKSVNSSTSTIQYIEYKLTKATQTWNKVLFDFPKFKYQGLEISEKNILKEFDTRLNSVLQNTTGTPDIDKLDQLARTLKIDKHQGSRGSGVFSAA